MVYAVEKTSNKTFVYSLTMQNNRFNTDPIFHPVVFMEGRRIQWIISFAESLINILVTISCITNDLTYCNVIVHLGQPVVGGWFSTEYTPSLTTYHHVVLFAKEQYEMNFLYSMMAQSKECVR